MTLKQRRPCPEEDAHFLSRITWWWQTSQFWNGWRRPLKYDDLADLNTKDKSRVIAPRFLKNWDRELKKAGFVWLRLRIITQFIRHPSIFLFWTVLILQIITLPPKVKKCMNLNSLILNQLALLINSPSSRLQDMEGRKEERRGWLRNHRFSWL